MQGWYAWFLENVVLPNASLWAHVVAWGELAVGIALVLGAFTGIAAFFAGFMNLNFLLAGAVSVNPVLFTLSVGLMLAWKVAGYLGCDYFLLPLLGTPWSSAPSVSSSGDRFWREGLHCRSETMVLALWYTGCAYAPTLISKQRMITLNHYSTTSPDGSPKASLSVARED